MRKTLKNGGTLILAKNKDHKKDIYKFLKGMKNVMIEPKKSQGEEYESLIKKYKDLCKQGNPVLIATAKGKFGTGFDFKDELLRNLVLAGCPYPSLKN
jgi:Rad3-related DNA helicase